MENSLKRITAILGPTNTGKTHLAVETMLKYESGIIGFPLRLLAREVFDKCVNKVGTEKVALITGEEKIIPKSPKFYICTVESMPQDLIVDFVAVDEIQMCADHERGHIFTDRLLNARGDKLTMFLGSHIIKSVIASLINKIEFVSRERYSKLTYSGYKKISRLNPKTALIAFSVDEVYAIAELVRRQKGGAAIIMGSLSPKTRNSQVELYESGDTNFLVATDAIGMGINMNIENVSFSSLKKFDGKKTRKLSLNEMSQIAGRAGRHINDGTFGVTGECKQLSYDEIEKLEKHELNKINTLYWRNSDINFDSFDNLIFSLEKKTNNEFLKRINDCEDEKVLKLLLKDNDNFKKKHSKDFIKILWECCQIPDFEKKAYGQHINIIDKVFQFLSTRNKKIPSNFMKEQLKGLEKDHGNVDLLSHRLSNVRTWSYVANKKNWVENSDYWVQLTKNIEDKLSDKLHDELTKSFIDKKISILSRSLKQDIILKTEINEENKIYIDEQLIGELKGLKFIIELTSKTLDTDIKSIKKAARKGVREELNKRVNKIIENQEISIDPNSNIIWKGNSIGRLKKGHNYLNPEIEIVADESIELEIKLKLEEFLKKWFSNYINKILGDLINLTKQKKDNQYLRALVFQLYEKNGVIKRSEIDSIVKLIPAEERKKLWGMGIKIGRYHVYLPKMLKPKAVEFRISLWKLFYNLAKKHEIPKFGLNFIINKNYEKNFLLLCGFEKFKDYFVRIDILEKLFIKILDNSKDHKFKINSEMMNLLGCTKENFYKLMTYMDYKKDKAENTYIFKGERKKKTEKFIKFDKKDKGKKK